MKKLIMAGIIILCFYGCRKKVMSSLTIEPTFTATNLTDTIFRSPATVTFFKGSVTGSAMSLTRARISIVVQQGMELGEITNLSLIFVDNIGQRLEYTLPSVAQSQTVDIVVPFQGTQQAEVTLSALVSTKKGGRIKMELELFYTTPTMSGSIQRSGSFIRFESASASLEIKEQVALRSVVTSEKPTLIEFSLKGEGLAQRVTILHSEYVGSLGYHTITSLALLNKQGVQIASAQNVGGKFTFTGMNEDIATLKEYSLVPTLNQEQGFRTGDRFTIRIISFTTKEVVSGKEVNYMVNKTGNEVVAYKSMLEIKTNLFPSSPLINGDQRLSYHTFTMKGGDGTLVQIPYKIILADNGTDSTMDIRNLRVRVNGMFLEKEIVFFSKRNGDSVNVYGESDSEIFATFLGGISLFKDVVVTIEFFGTIRGISTGDAVATAVSIDDPLDLPRRTLSRAQGQHIARLHTSSTLSSDGVVYGLLWSDRSSRNHSAVMGIASDDFINGQFIDKKNLAVSVLQR